MIDRDARDGMATAIEDYLNDGTTAFAFDDQLTELSARTRDETVRQIAHALWFHYDDCRDHNVVLSRPEWDYVQRLLLVLKSDASVRVDRLRIWSWRQMAAAVLLGCLCAISASLGWGLHLLIVAIPFGAASVILSWCRRQMPASHRNHLIRLVPFASLEQVSAVRRRTAGFKKHRYPPALIDRRIRSPLMSRLIDLQFLLIWMVLAPIALVGQLLPDVEEHLEVIVN